MFGRRILILVAHPDDEVVGCAAAIGRARALGATVSALYLTHGCLAREVMWPWERKKFEAIVAQRRAEGEAAALALGIQPVGWAKRAAREVWPNMAAVCAEVQAAIEQYKPDQLWVPAYEGGNPDHDALNAIGLTFKKRLSVLEFAEYNYFGGRAHSQTFLSGDEAAHIIELTPEERRGKRAALEIYESEQGNLSYVEIDQEAFRQLANYDYTRPPHQGTLWYERFQWVPFRHPRVDFTKGREVCAAIGSFLK